MLDEQRRSTLHATAPARSHDPNAVISDVLWLRCQLDQIASNPAVGGAKQLLADVAPVLEPVWGIVGPLGGTAGMVGHLRRFGDQDVSDLALVHDANASVEYRAALAFQRLDLAAPSRRQIWEALARPATALLASVDVSTGCADHQDLAPPLDGLGSLQVNPRPLLPGELLTAWDDEAQVVPALRRVLRAWCDIARNATGERREVAQLTLAAALLTRGAALDGDTDTVRWFIDRWLGLAPTETRVDGAIAALLADGWRRPSVDPEFSGVQDTITDLRIRATCLRTEVKRQHRLHRPVWETQLGQQPIALLYDTLPGGSGVDGSAPMTIAGLCGSGDAVEQEASQILLKEQLREVLKTVSEREAAVALGFAEGKPWAQIARELGITRYRLDGIRGTVFRKLRHPSRSQVLRDYLDNYS
jgi:DNA-binding CsgD family transcriptional regulator